MQIKRILFLCVLIGITGLSRQRLHASGFDPLLFGEKDAALEFKTPSFKLILRGELELTLRDLEGRGGPGHDSSTDTRTIGTRSPTFVMDGLGSLLALCLRVGSRSTPRCSSPLNSPMPTESFSNIIPRIQIYF